MILKNFSDLTPELIVWEDINQCNETWASATDIQTWLGDVADCHVEHIGYIIAEDEKYIIITDSCIESSEIYGNVTKIPKGVILSRKKLTTNE